MNVLGRCAETQFPVASSHPPIPFFVFLVLIWLRVTFWVRPAVSNGSSEPGRHAGCTVSLDPQTVQGKEATENSARKKKKTGFPSPPSHSM